MAHDLIHSVAKERIQAAVDRTLRLYADQGEARFGTLAWAAVEEAFCICMTGAGNAAEKHLSALHATLVAEILRRAEKRLDDQSQSEAAEQRKSS